MSTNVRRFQNNYVLYLIAAILAAMMLNVPFCIKDMLVDKGPTWLGLDVSWKYTLNTALAQGQVWGKDIIYTYGPLGFLATRCGIGIPSWAFLAFDLFVVFNFFML